MQLSDIRTRVRYHLRESSASIWADAEINAWINLAQNFVALRIHPQLIPSIVTTATVVYAQNVASASLPADFLKAAGDGYGTLGNAFPFKELREVIKQGYSHNLDANSFFTNRRACWVEVVSGTKTLFISPTTHAAENVYLPYVMEPNTLSGDSDVSEIDDGVIDLVIMKAAADALVKTRELKESALLMQELEKRIQSYNGSILA